MGSLGPRHATLILSAVCQLSSTRLLSPDNMQQHTASNVVAPTAKPRSGHVDGVAPLLGMLQSFTGLAHQLQQESQSQSMQQAQAKMTVLLDTDQRLGCRSFRNTMLGAALSVLKLAYLLGSVQAASNAAATAHSALWKTLYNLHCCLPSHTNSTANSYDVEAEEELHTSLLLTQMLVPAMRLSSKETPVVAETCCHLLTAMISGGCYQASWQTVSKFLQAGEQDYAG